MTTVGQASGKSLSQTRGFTSAGFQSLALPARDLLLRTLLVESGHAVLATTPRGTSVDVLVSVDVLMQARTMLIRLTDQGANVSDLTDLADDAERAGCDGYLMVGRTDDDPVLATGPHYLSPNAIVELIEQSALVTWHSGVPQADFSRYEAHCLALSSMKQLDPCGLLWVRTLSLNKLPLELHGSTPTAAMWFETVIFRIATRLLGLRGWQLGAGAAGKREPDAYFACGGTATLLDTKAARDGFVMDAKEELKLLSYMRKKRRWHGAEIEPNRMVIVSSSFGTTLQYQNRATAFASEGWTLSYVTADAVLELASRLAAHERGSEIAHVLDWNAILDAGEVEADICLAEFEAAEVRLESAMES